MCCSRDLRGGGKLSCHSLTRKGAPEVRRVSGGEYHDELAWRRDYRQGRRALYAFNEVASMFAVATTVVKRGDFTTFLKTELHRVKWVVLYRVGLVLQSSSCKPAHFLSPDTLDATCAAK